MTYFTYLYLYFYLYFLKYEKLLCTYIIIITYTIIEIIFDKLKLTIQFSI